MRNKVVQAFGYTPSKKSTSEAESDCDRLNEYSPSSSSRMNEYSERKNSGEDLSKAQRCCSTLGVNMKEMAEPGL